jgi:hypothetical protein
MLLLHIAIDDEQQGTEAELITPRYRYSTAGAGRMVRTVLVSIAFVAFAAGACATQSGFPTPTPLSCEPAGNAATPDGVVLRSQTVHCDRTGACPTELVVVSEGCIVTSWRPAQKGAEITSVSQEGSFSPPMLAVVWEQQTPHHQGFDALVLQDNVLLRVGSADFAHAGNDDRTSCDWKFVLPNDPTGRNNRVIAHGHCEMWAPSEPDQPSFTPLELYRTVTYLWNGEVLKVESDE